MPEYQPPHVDKKETISEHHRLKMLELAIDGIEGLAIETIELERKGISYTYDTMKILTEKNPDTDYYFIIGADMVDYLPKWYRIDELVDMVQFVGVQRPRYKAGTSYPVIWVDVPLMDISSSMVRDFIAQGRTPNFLLPKPVLDYIEKKGSTDGIPRLYQLFAWELLEKMAELLPEKRLTHCLGVERAAIELAQRFGVDVEKAGLAGLLHDYAKKLSDQEFLNLIDRYQLDPDLKNWGNNVWHGMVGIYKIQEDLNLQDSEILRAIEIHTVGAGQMTDLDKVIYVADLHRAQSCFSGSGPGAWDCWAIAQ